VVVELIVGVAVAVVLVVVVWLSVLLSSRSPAGPGPEAMGVDRPDEVGARPGRPGHGQHSLM